MPRTRREIRAATRVRIARLRGRRRAAGLCLCGAAREVGAKCLGCWFASVSANCTGSTRHAAALRRQWVRQGGRCFYSGAMLVPGRSASVDHKVPRSRGGTDHPSNLVWADRRVNASKSDMTPDEYVALCRLIVRRHRAKAA